jgi:hypothetical protein
MIMLSLPAPVQAADAACAPGEDYDAGLCYPQCSSGYTGVGPVCWEDCRSGYTDDGAFCRQDFTSNAKDSYGRGVGTIPQGCPAGYEKDGLLCYPECRAGYTGVGPVCWQDCPAGFADLGLTCSRSPTLARENFFRSTPSKSCPAGKQDEAGLCYTPCGSGFTGVGPLCSRDNCDSGYTEVLGVCVNDSDAENTYLLVSRNFFRAAGTPLVCPSGSEDILGICYSGCPSGYSIDGLSCAEDCPAGYTATSALLCSTADIFREKDSYGRGVGEVPRNCGSQEYDAGLCYAQCRPGYDGVGPVCWESCPPGWVDDGAFCREVGDIYAKSSVGRGVGSIPPGAFSGQCSISYPTTFNTGIERRYNEITWLTAHNAIANTEAGFTHVMQTYDLREQLDGGVRGVMLDIHERNGDIALCHSGDGCPDLAVGSGFAMPFGAPPETLASNLQVINSFLEDNPTEIVTVLFESAHDESWVQRLQDIFQASGVLDKIYDHDCPNCTPRWPGEGWPSLQWMIDNNKRLVLFTQDGDDVQFSALYPDKAVAGVMSQAKSRQNPPTPEPTAGQVGGYTVENTYDIGAGLACETRWDPTLEPLNVQPRPGGIDRVFVMNHFRSLPAAAVSLGDNAYDTLLDRVRSQCLPAAEKLPNFLAVDYFHIPECDPVDVVATLNRDDWQYRAPGVDQWQDTTPPPVDTDKPAPPRPSLTTQPTVRESSCRIDAAQKLPPPKAPPGMATSSNQIDFVLSGCDAGEAVDIEVDFNEDFPTDAVAYKVVGDTWTEIEGATIDGSRVRYQLRNNGPLDTDPDPNRIHDPIVVAFTAPPLVIDTLSGRMLALLGGLLILLAIVANAQLMQRRDRGRAS